MTWPGDYTKSQEVTIFASQVDADVVDFPVLLTEANFQKAGADIFDTCSEGGGDIRTSTGELTGQTAREVVTCITATPKLEMHTIRTLDSSSNTPIWVSYNGTDTEPAEDSTYGSENTWKSAYKVVQHLEEAVNNDADGYVDSTSNDNDGTGTSMSIAASAAQIGLGQNFDGSADFINLGASTGAPLGANERTISIWAKIDAFSSSTTRPIITYTRQVSNGKGFWVFAEDNAISIGFVGHRIITTTTSLSTGILYQIKIVVPSGAATTDDVKIYINAIDQTLDDEAGSFQTLDSELLDIEIGRDGASSYFDGQEDEFRLSNIGETSTWISTEYNNQSSPGTFYSVSDEQGAAPAVRPLPQRVLSGPFSGPLNGVF